MLRTSLRIGFACTALVSVAGCNRSVFSPPARPLPLESAATLPKGDTGVAAEGAAHSAPFGPDAVSGTVRVRHGVADDLDLAVEASALRIGGGAPRANLSRFIHSARGGVKYRVVKSFSVVGGLGGGYSAGGAFVSPDMGPIVAWENRHCVPFLAARGGVSQPIGSREVDTSGSDEPPGTHVDTPRTTWMFGVVTGLRVPIGWAEPEAGTTRGSLLAGVGFTHLADARDKETFSSLSLGGEIVF